MSQKKAIVIGSGVSGMSIAIRLAKKGYQVTVFEANEKLGGKITRLEKDGFKWGFGASLLTLPELIDELFVLAGKNPKDYYHYQRLNPITRYFFPDKTVVNAYAEREKFANEIASKTTDSAESVINYLKRIENAFRLTENTFLHKSLHRLRTYLSLEALKIAALSPTTLGLFSTVHKRNALAFKDPRTIQLFDRYATYNGSNPYKAPGVLNIIAHPEFNQGAFILEDGMPSLIENLHKLGKNLGVEYKTLSPVEEILIENKHVKGIKSNGQIYNADLVISNMDVYYTYKKLLPQFKAPEKYLNQERSTSTIIYYWGMNKPFPQLEVHNILFSDNYVREFEHLSNGTMYEDPTVYIFISSKINPGHAPEKCENWFVLINAPHHQGQDWEAQIKKMREKVINKINTILETDIRPHIVSEIVNHPQSIQTITQSYAGALYGNSTNKVMSTFLRHPNFNNKIKNLYFCGGSVHPGGGVPICLLSAKITDELIG